MRSGKRVAPTSASPTLWATKGRRTTSTFDPNGTLVRSIDTSYDALNRIASASYPASAEIISYTYDIGSSCTNGLGKLCGLTDASGTTSYGYDAFGNLSTQVHTELGIAYTTRYSYDARAKRGRFHLMNGGRNRQTKLNNH